MNDSPDEIPTFAELAADPEIAALLDFTPVPRRNVVPGGWGPEKQREFIARLATHGSKNKACTEMCMQATGMTKVQNSPGAQSFREAFGAAVELSMRRREEKDAADYVNPGEKLPTVDHRFREPRVRGGDSDGPSPRSPSASRPSPAWAEGEDGDCPHCGGHAEPEWRRQQREREDQLRHVRRSLFMARRAYLLSIADDPERQAAWELLCGPADWDAASAMQEQPDELPGSADVTPLRQATLQIPLKTGFMPHFTDPDWDSNADPLPQLERSVIRHDPRGPEWAREPPSSAPGFPGEGDHGQHGGGAEGEGD
jgi:hypothetical protein